MPVPRRSLLFTGFLVLFAVHTVARAADNGWELVMQEPGLTVERRPYEGSSLAELRGITVVDSSLSELIALLRDAPYNEQWVYRSGGAEIIHAEGFAQVYVHGVVDAPLPLRDRDTVVRFDYEQDPRSRVITIRITNHPDYLPRREGYVRVPDFGGYWQLRPLAGGGVEVTYQVHGDPGGWVPWWLANYAAEVSVTRTLQNIHDAVQRYRGRVLPEVEELPLPGVSSDR